MDIAKCTLDDTNYYATTFAKLGEPALSMKRRHLICIGCGFPAYFKRAARSGQGACFGARPHGPDCDPPSPESAKGLHGDEDQDVIRNPGDHIVLDLNYGAHQPLHGDPGGPAAKGSRSGRFSGNGSRGPAQMRRRLSTILRNLINSEQFRQATALVEIPKREVLPINEFFVNFEDIDPEHIGKFRGYWGLVFDVGNSANGSLWLNTGKGDDVSALMERGLYADFRKRLKIDHSDELEGMHLLVLGSLEQAKSGKRWIKIDDLNLCSLCDD